ncbi:universal stress protein [Nocardia noduli]|uniref:universal stress protein n=1 Tax=Nocardia noduli TaxID=2815722 RepID=UPI001C244F1F|nr:universal stress protein [Nocardia noduli]
MSVQSADDPHRLVSADVVVGIDGSEPSDLAVRWAAETASRRRRRLRIVHGLDLAAAQAVLGMYDLMVPAVTEALREQGERRLATAHRLAREIDPELIVETELSDGHPAKILIDASESAHLMVLGAGTRRPVTHLGSTLLAVTAHARGSVVVVRDTGTEQQTRRTGPVVVGIDGSPANTAAAATAFAEASLRDAPLVAVHAANDISAAAIAGLSESLPTTLPTREMDALAREVLSEQLAGWQEKYPDVTVTRKVYVAEARKHLLAWSETAQLVVVGSRGRGGFLGMILGSTSNALVQQASCPVLVAHPE